MNPQLAKQQRSAGPALRLEALDKPLLHDAVFEHGSVRWTLQILPRLNSEALQPLLLR